jgi:hypothetical protein
MRLLVLSGLLLLIFSCKSKNDAINQAKSYHPYINYFYPYDSTPRIYCYRNVANGLDEEFHRIYAIKDQKGHHIVVEKYASNGRILEALNYNYDSLTIIDHMVVDRNNHKNSAPLTKNKMIPWNDKEQTWFYSEYPSHFDSTIVINELKRKVIRKNVNITVLEDESRKAIVFSDFRQMTLKNIFTSKTIQSINTEGESIFAEGFGLIEFYSKNKIAHFKLEKVISQKEWIQFISR